MFFLRTAFKIAEINTCICVIDAHFILVRVYEYAKKKHDMSLNVAYFQYAMISAQKITIWGILISVSDKMNVILIQVWKTFI